MRKTEFAFWAFTVLAVMAAATTVFNLTRPQTAVASSKDQERIFELLDLFGNVFEKVRADYVDPPNEKKMIEDAINGMLAQLDPHSAFLNARHYEDMEVQSRGRFGGLGIEVTMEKGMVKVVTPIDDTPAASAGLRAGDYIIRLDSEDIVGVTLQKAVEKMRGPVGSPIVLTILRKGVDEPFDVKVVRDIIRINPVKAKIEGDGQIGYIRVTSFNELTYEGLKKAVARLRKKIGAEKLKGFIIDLRNNPGGLLDQAIAVSDAFLERGAIVLTRGRNVEETQRFSARPGDITDKAKIVVLINGGSASASEIVAGALQDHHRAVIMGTRSFGKGSVQTIIRIGKAALKLTTARYLTPSGCSIQALGIKPDVKVIQPLPDELKKKKIRTRGEAQLRNHLKSQNGEELSGSSSYVPRDRAKDAQITYAVNYLLGKEKPFVPGDAVKCQTTAKKADKKTKG